MWITSHCRLAIVTTETSAWFGYTTMLTYTIQSKRFYKQKAWGLEYPWKTNVTLSIQYLQPLNSDSRIQHTSKCTNYCPWYAFKNNYSQKYAGRVKKNRKKWESVCVSPTSVVSGIIEFQTIRRVLRKEKPLKMCKWRLMDLLNKVCERQARRRVKGSCWYSPYINQFVMQDL